jgi:hypothetical protein
MAVNDCGADSPLHYSSDSTRTIPIGGKFVGPQRDLYDAVLRAHKKALACLDRSNVVVYVVWATPTPRVLSARPFVDGVPPPLTATLNPPANPPGAAGPTPLLVPDVPVAPIFNPFAEVLSRLTARTGGSVWPAAAGSDLSRQFVSLLQEFRSRCLLIYEPTGVRRDDGWHEVKVRVKEGRSNVKARPGYHAGSR